MSFFIQIIINRNISFIMCVNEDMLFKELVNYFYKNTGLNQENKATFIFNLNAINSDSINKLKDFGIHSNSVIQDMPNIQIQQNNSQIRMNMNNYGNMNTNLNIIFKGVIGPPQNF